MELSLRTVGTGELLCRKLNLRAPVQPCVTDLKDYLVWRNKAARKDPLDTEPKAWTHSESKGSTLLWRTPPPEEPTALRLILDFCDFILMVKFKWKLCVLHEGTLSLKDSLGDRAKFCTHCVCGVAWGQYSTLKV